MGSIHRFSAFHSGKPGFALLVTLLLMILLTIIAVGLLSLSAVSLRASSQEDAAAVARANARLALMLAIGELQHELGPDQRVNAPAAILSDDNGKSGSAAPGRRHWLGAYDSWNSTSNALRPAPKFRRWLVSGPESLATDPGAPDSEAAADELLWTGLNADGSDKVSVPKVLIGAAASGKAGGSYAWWVGDENSKALVSRLPQNMGQLAHVRADAQSAPLAAYHLAAPLSGIDRKAPQAGRLVSHRTVDLAGTDTSAAAKTFHDFTVFSEGVLTDVARGGLKRDLSLFLDHPVSKPLAAKLPNDRRLYAKGITWEELWLYHNAWRALEPPAAGLMSMTGGDLTNSQILMTPPGQQKASIEAFSADPYALYKIPAFLRAQWVISMWAQQNVNNPAQYNLFWVNDPILTLWNPLDVPIALHPQSYISYVYRSIPYSIRIMDDQGLLAQKTFLGAVTGDPAVNDFSLQLLTGTATNLYWPSTGTADPVVLMPGEVLMMSENASAGEPIPYNSNRGARSLRAKAGWNLGRGRRIPVNPSRPVTANSNLKFEAFANTTIIPSGSNLVRFNTYYGPYQENTNLPPAGLNWFLSGRAFASSTRASDHPDVFPSVQGELPAAAAMTGSGKHPFFLFAHQTKSEDSATAWCRMYQPRNSNAVVPDLEPMTVAMSGHEVRVDALSGSQDSRMVQLSTNQINRGLFGGSYWDHTRGTDTLITHSIPREPPVSLGAFQHAIANGATTRLGGAALHPNMGALAPAISHAISNSYALPVLSPDQTDSSDFTDHSYHVNRMLWDSWFSSGIVQRQAPHHPTKKTAKQVYEDFLDDPAESLANRRMKAVPGAVSEGGESLFAENGDAKADSHEIASSELMVEGAFNVNSTSVEAWKAILGSMDEAFIPVANGTNSPTSADAHQTSGVPVTGLLTAYGSGTDKDSAAFESSALASAGNPAQWRGYRKLNESEIEELAKALVEEIRKRGPFLSMADFINRRPGSDKNLALFGPLQAALDRTVNATLFAANGRVGTDPGNVYPFPEAAELPKSAISPAHVRQADILTAIGSQLSVRSDTFRIRAYGESKDHSGNVLARAWCEAVVQRVPGYVDPADPAHAADAPSADPEPRTVPALTSAANRNLGRRIEIRSFRWISQDDIES